MGPNPWEIGIFFNLLMGISLANMYICRPGTIDKYVHSPLKTFDIENMVNIHFSLMCLMGLYQIYQTVFCIYKKEMHTFNSETKTDQSTGEH